MKHPFEFEAPEPHPISMELNSKLIEAGTSDTKRDKLIEALDKALTAIEDELYGRAEINEPTFTEPMEALEFLAGRMEYAGVGEAVAKHYAKDIRRILKAYAPVQSPEARAIKEYLSRPAPQFYACGCLGPQGDDPKCPPV